MDNTKKFLLCAIAVSIAFTGCSDDSSNSPSNTVAPQAESSSATIYPNYSSSSYGLSSATITSSAKTISSSGTAEVSSSSVEVQTSPLTSAGFYETLTINSPTASNGGTVRCSFDGSEPLATTEPMTAPRALSQNTVIRRLMLQED